MQDSEGFLVHYLSVNLNTSTAQIYLINIIYFSSFTSLLQPKTRLSGSKPSFAGRVEQSGRAKWIS